MTLTLVCLLLVIAGMIFFFLTERQPVDLVALVGLVLLTLVGVLTPEEAFSGLSAEPTVTLVAVFFLSGALRETGLADLAGQYMFKFSGGSESRGIVAVMLIGALFSSFMNNVAATALLLPAVMNFSAVARISPSLLLIPLSFGVILGGMTTLIGTPPNMVASHLLHSSGQTSFQLFEFLPFGLAAVGLGTLFMLVWGRFLIPIRVSPRSPGSRIDLMRMYQLSDRLFSVRLPHDSPLNGETIARSGVGEVLGGCITVIERGGQRQYAPRATDILRQHDVLVVRGRITDFHLIKRYRGMDLADFTGFHRLVGKTFEAPMVGAQIIVKSGSLVGKTVREAGLKERFDVSVVGIMNSGKLEHANIADLRLDPGSVVYVLGSPAQLQALSEATGVWIEATNISLIQLFGEHLLMLKLPKSSALAGASLRETRLGELCGLTTIAVLRSEETIIAPGPEFKLEAEDALVVLGKAAPAKRLLSLANLELISEQVEVDLESREVGLVEVVLSPRSSFVGQTLSQISFHERYDFHVLAILREGTPLRSRLGRLPLKFGDALLLQGPRQKISLLGRNPSFVVLNEPDTRRKRTDKAVYAVLAVALMIGINLFDLYSPAVAAILAALVVISSGALSMEEAYREVEWRIVVLVAALIPLGIAFEKTNLSSMLASWLQEIGLGVHPLVLILTLAAATSLLSQVLEGIPAIVLAGPVALHLAKEFGFDPRPLMMAVALGASVTFLTPFSHKANLLVMGAGGYKSGDYFRVGLAMTLIVFVVMLVLIPLIYQL